MGTRHPLLDTFDEMLRLELPNFLRLYLNPYVAHTCLCLSRYVRETWYAEVAPPPEFPSFLANSFDEALSGAMKLGRFCAERNESREGLILDPEGRTGPTIAARLRDRDTIEFIPDVQIMGKTEVRAGVKRRNGPRPCFVAVFPTGDFDPGWINEFLVSFERTPAPRLIACVSRDSLDSLRRDASSPWRSMRPDIVVFDESFVRKHVPFGGFTARRALYDRWNRQGLAGFHSTTFQPNTVASLHFLHCLERDDPALCQDMAAVRDRLAQDAAYCRAIFARLYSPSLARTISTVGWARTEPRARGNYVHVQGRKVFDGVSGVACSVRGHNPQDYLAAIEDLDGVRDVHALAGRRLRRASGLGNFVPAVSGACAVENALRLGLAAQHPRSYVLAFSNGFGGKTLLALAGTAKTSYKTGIDPLYPHVLYVDPFGDRALEDLEAALSAYPVGIVQLELIQGVGGVRALPEKVVHYLNAQKERWDYLLFVDEIQTGMYRTGPFLRSHDLGIEPDLVTIGKGVSDMMFPFAVTLYSDRVHELLQTRMPELAGLLCQRCDYEFGYKTLINVLDYAEAANVSDHVRECGNLFEALLGLELSRCRAVRHVRVFGLLIAVELDTQGWPLRWFRKQAGSLYLLNLLRHEPFPVLCGFCQYEPHVLKLTPPLSIARKEVRRVCETMTAVFQQPSHRLLSGALRSLLHRPSLARWKSHWRDHVDHERLER